MDDMIDTNFEKELNLVGNWAVSRRNNAFVTSLDVIERALSLKRTQSVRLARQLQARGWAKYVQGRHGRKSRIVWTGGGLWGLVDVLTAPTNLTQ